MLNLAYFLIAGKVICNAVKFAYDFMAFKKIAVYYVRFQNCLDSILRFII